MPETFLNWASDLRAIEVLARNKFKWWWLEEKDDNDDLLSDYIRKLPEDGVCFCVYCEHRLCYGQRGRSLITRHAMSGIHRKNRILFKINRTGPSQEIEALNSLENGELVVENCSQAHDTDAGLHNTLKTLLKTKPKKRRASSPYSYTQQDKRILLNQIRNKHNLLNELQHHMEKNPDGSLRENTGESSRSKSRLNLEKSSLSHQGDMNNEEELKDSYEEDSPVSPQCIPPIKAHNVPSMPPSFYIHLRNALNSSHSTALTQNLSPADSALQLSESSSGLTEIERQIKREITQDEDAEMVTSHSIATVHTPSSTLSLPQSMSDGQDEDFAFFKGMLPAFRKLTTKNKTKAMRAIANSIFDLLEDQSEESTVT